MGLILQELSARLGVVTGKDLAQNVNQRYPKWLNWIVYVNMEIAVIASDIQEVVGSGIAITLLTNGFIPVWVGCIITGLDTFTFLAVHYLGVRYLEALVCFLVACMSVSFFINWGETHADPAELIKGWVIPMMPSYAITQAVGTIGAVIMPHNLYLHSGLVLSRKVDRSNPHKVYEATWDTFLESALALRVAFCINLAIVATKAGNFYSNTCALADGGPYSCLNPSAIDGGAPADAITCVQPTGGAGVCNDLGLKGEGAALEHGLGKAALYVWAVGLLAAGQAATMTCTYAGQIIMGGCLEIHLAPWKRVALTRAAALGPSILVSVLTISNDELFNSINEYLNVLQSVQLPFAMLPLLNFTSKTEVMGRFRSQRVIMLINFVLAGIVLGINAVLVIQFAENYNTTGIVCVCCYAVLYLGCCFRLLLPCRSVQ
jgi:natural resistance-associated macrophage protein